MKNASHIIAGPRDEGNISLLGIGLVGVLLLVALGVLGVSSAHMQRNIAQDHADVLAMTVSESYADPKYYGADDSEGLWTEESVQEFLRQTLRDYPLPEQATVQAHLETGPLITVSIEIPLDLNGFGQIFAAVMPGTIHTQTTVRPLPPGS